MKSLLKKLEWKHKNNKFLYYTSVFGRWVIPAVFFRARLTTLLSSVKNYDLEYLKTRVNHYNKLTGTEHFSDDATPIGKMRIPDRQRVYYFDSQEYLRYFNPALRAKFMFGDVTTVPSEPSIVKSRPISDTNSCSVVLKLDKVRHFMFTNDTKNFSAKKNMLVGRGVVKQPHRIRFYEMYFNHPMCNLGQINRKKNQHWIRERLTIEEHLDYKFILCIEGNDVASNLKWVMSSNSLAVMPRPKFETWFMEAKLIANYHYVAIKDDYSDLEERLTYYINHPEEAQNIIRNAHTYINQFKLKKQEDLISLLVLEKYFYRTKQLEPVNRALYDQ